MNAERTSWWTRWRPRLWRRRWLLAALVLIVLVRVNLPWILRRVLVSQVSDTLQADVALGDVDLALYKAGVVLEDFAVGLRSAQAGASAGAGGGASAPAQNVPPPVSEAAGPSTPGVAQPIVAWKSLAVSVRYLPLARQTIQLRELVLDSPQVHVDRLASGEFNYEALIRAAMRPADTPDGAPPPADDGTAAPPPPPEAAPAGGESEAAESGWWLGIDRLALLGGHIRFRDFTLEGSEPINIAIPTIEIRDISMSPDLYGKPSESRVKIGLDEGALEVGARAGMSGDNINVECDVDAQGLPLRHARLYVPGVGWRELTGALDADLTYRLETAKVNEVRGTVALRDLSVRVPELPDPALTLKRLAVRVDPLDLLGQMAAVAEVDLSGAWVLVFPKGPVQVPLIGAPAGGAAAEAGPTPTEKAAPTESTPANASPPSTEATPPTAQGDVPPAPAEPGGKPAESEATPTEAHAEPDAETGTPWRWAVQAIRVSDSGVRLRSDEATLDVRLGAQVTDLAPEPDKLAHVNFTVGIGDGSVQVEGGTRLEPPAFAGDVTVSGLSLSEPIAISGAAPPGLVESAKLDTRLAVEAGMAKAEGAAVGPRDVRTTGTVSLADAVVRSGDTKIGIARVEVEIGEISLPGAMPPPTGAGESGPTTGTVRLRGGLSVRDASVGLVAPTPAAGDGGAPPPAKPPGQPASNADFLITLAALDLALSDLTLPGVLGGAPATPEPPRAVIAELKLEKPVIRMTRTAAGIVLPSGQGAPPGETAATATPQPGAAQQTATPTPPPAADSASKTAASATTPAAEIALNSLRIGKGRFTFADRTLKPPFAAAFDDITVGGRDLRFPELTGRELRVSLTTPGEGEIEMAGEMSPRSGKMQLDVRNVALIPYNPYATAYSPYRVASGGLSVSTGLKRSGTTFKAANEITLQDFDIEGAGGEGVFERQFGIPLATALALLRDPAGKISLNVPVEVGERGTSVDVMAVVARALRAALVGALTSPLKLVGSLTGGGGKVGSFAPAPIGFQLGRPEATKDGATIIERLAALLESRPAMGVELRAIVTAADARSLREQALLARWGEEGFVSGLLALADRGARTRVREALEARAQGEPGSWRRKTRPRWRNGCGTFRR